MNEPNVMLREPSSSKFRYEGYRAVVRFCEPVTADSIFALCDEIDLAIDYYFYRQITVEINSPGGEAAALHYYIQKLQGWRQAKVSIETVALTQCYSAAALMLSLGDLGRRFAMPRASLLYHNARMFVSGQQPLTSKFLEKTCSHLSLTDAEMLAILLRHLYGQLEPSCFDTLEEIVCALPNHTRQVGGKHLEQLGLSGLDKRLSALATGSQESRQYRRSELQRLLTGRLARCGKGLVKLTEPSELLSFLEAYPPERRHELTVAWLWGRFLHYQTILDRDESIHPPEAIKEGLIDEVLE